MAVGLIQFEEFVLDCDRYELLRGDRKVKLEKIPMELLILLASRNGHLVTRQEIIQHLWGADVFVDTEHGINTAVRKIRLALRDEPDQPRFVQTVTGKGYRFVAVKEEVRKPQEAVATLSSPSYAELPAPQARKARWQILLAVVTVVAIIAAVFFLRWVQSRQSASSQIQSIAVLPLTNLSGDASKDYFADGMTDEIITALAKNRSLRVVSRTTVMQYKNAKRPLREIARELGVDGIIEGSIENSGSRVHMTVQLIHAASDTHLWAESYDRETRESFSLAADLSQDVAREVNLAVGPKKSRYVSPEAHDAYLRGRYFWFRDNYDRAEEYFAKSKELQPDYAAAWTGLADVLTARAVGGQLPSGKVREPAEAAARKAVELDDSLAEAHNALAASYFFLEWDWKRAEQESRRAIELSPNLAEPHHLRSYEMAALNRMDDALLEQKKSSELDPFQRPWALGFTYLQMRRYDDAIRELEMRKEGLPNDVYTRFILSDAYAHKGMWKQAAVEYEQGLRSSGSKSGVSVLQQQLRQNGPRAMYEFALQHEINDAKKGYVSPVDLANLYASVGKKEESLHWLEVAYNERTAGLVFIQGDPAYDPMHSEARYRAIIKNMGLPSAY